MTKIETGYIPKPAGVNDESEIDEIPIDYLLHDVLILKAECLCDKKLLGYCEYLEKQLFKIKNGEARIKE